MSSTNSLLYNYKPKEIMKTSPETTQATPETAYTNKHEVYEAIDNMAKKAIFIMNTSQGFISPMMIKLFASIFQADRVAKSDKE